MLLPLRSVLLSVEDPTFAALAAMSTSTMLEDENLPDFGCPDFGSSPPSLPLPVLPQSPVEIINEKKSKNRQTI